MGETDTDIGYLLNKATRQSRLGLARALAGTGLTPQQAAVLLAVGRSEEGRLTPRSIADAIDADQATTSGLLDRLTRDGWLVSEQNPGDGRSRLIGLSATGEKTLPAVMDAAHAASVETTRCLGCDELATLAELLSKLCGETGSVSDAVRGSRR